MDEISDFKKLENENYHSYIWRMDELVQSGKYQNWKEITPMVNKELFDEDESQYRDESAYRKAVKYARDFYEAGVFGNNEDEYFKKLQLERQSLEKEKVKTRDERNELKRVIREEARKESYKEQIMRSISEYHCNPLSYDENKQFTGILKTDNDLIISCTDIHAGIEIDNYFNKFNEDVLRSRFNQYLDKIFEVQIRHGSENAYVILSELVSGIIHNELRIENNQNLIEQFLSVTNYISQFLAELSYHFNTVNVYVCPGNHSRVMARKEESLKGENIDHLAIPFLQAKLQNFKNITFNTNSYKVKDSFKPVLTSVSKVLKKYNKTYVQIAGYTDNTGNKATNNTLSFNRANAVANYLKLKGVNANRMLIEGHGSKNPIASNSTAKGREKNRRVEITLVQAE